MHPERVRDLFHHMEWADSQVWAEALRRPEAASDRRLRELLHHVHEVQWAYLRILGGEPVEVPGLETFDSLEAIRAWAWGFYESVPDLLAGLGAEGLDRQVKIPWADRLVERFGKAEPVTVEETLLQVALHSTYHRGQINTRLRELGGEPPLTDWVAWLWMSRPSAERPDLPR